MRRRPVAAGEGRHAVAVIGDGAFGSGIVFEAMNNTAGLKQKLTVVLNDNKMSICPRVGGLANYLDQLRMTHVLHRAEESRCKNSSPGCR